VVEQLFRKQQVTGSNPVIGSTFLPFGDSRMTLVLLAAGMGSRFGGPKQLEPIGPNGATFLHVNTADAAAAGFTHVVAVTRMELEPRVRDEFIGSLPTGVTGSMAIQPTPGDKPRGTAEALAVGLAATEGIAAMANADDAYGPQAFQDLADLIAGTPHADGWALPYRCDITLSQEGGVSRALCQMQGNRLTDIVELFEVQRGTDGIIRGHDRSGQTARLADDAPVSMNLFAFRTSIRSQLARFLDDHFSQRSSQEALLTDFLGDEVRAGRMDVRVATTSSPWIGLTFREDLPRVRAALSARATS
jgi:hypothetical protein